MAKWIKTKFPGVRYREHATRKNGIKKDHYFTIRYKVRDGEKLKDKEEGLGWASDGWTAEEAYARARELKTNRKTGEGPQTLEEKRAKLKKEQEKENRRLEREGETISAYFDKKYFPWAMNNKAPNTTRSEKTLFDKWIEPVIGDIPLLKLAQTDIERLKKRMIDNGRAPKTIHLTLALIRQIYNHAKRPDIYLLAKAKMPRIDNAKLRYLTAEEIDKLLTALKKKSETVHDQALLAVNTGLRFSEVAGLQWEDINWETETLAIRDGKTGSRTVFFNGSVREMLKSRQEGQKTGLVFPDERGKRQASVSKTFQRVSDDLFNEGIKDRRLRVSFHTLRHTFGTHIYENTGDLYLTQKALGHRTLVMAQRYAKMGEKRLREAFTTMTAVIAKGKYAAQKNEDVINMEK